MVDVRTDILTAVAFQDQSFRLVSRQELSRQANGVTRGKDMGSAIWLADYTTTILQNDDALAYEAALNSLDGVIQPFEAGDLRRPFPRAYPSGSFTDAGTLHTVDANNKAIRIDGLDAGFVLSPGDYLAFDYGGSRALHQIVEAATADGSGLTPLFEVRPHLRPGWAVSAAIKLKNPKGLFTMLPGSIESRLQGGIHTVISFKAVQYL